MAEISNKEENVISRSKILVLHGYRQNAELFRQKTGSLRKMLNKFAHFTYVNGPHKVIPIDDLSKIGDVTVQENSDSEEYGWFFNRENNTYRGTRRGGPAIGFEASLHVVEKAFEDYGPFDGLLGFSQGACFVGLLCDLQQRGLTKIKFSFAIMCAGLKSNCLPHLKYFGEPLTLPTLHIYGETDEIIPKDMSEALRDSFVGPITVTHSGGHYLPATAVQKNAYLSFLQLQLQQKQSV